MPLTPGVLAAAPVGTADAPGDRATDSARRLAEIEAHVARLQDRHIAERFARAMELLGDEKAEVRWGGIYALERIAKRSPEDQSTVSEVLATYVRRRAALRTGTALVGEPAVSIESEIQIIVTILARRKWTFKSEERPLDLHGTNLSKAHLPFAHLERSFLYDCNLESALLFRSHLQGAWLARCRLKNANLDGAHLEGADLTDAVGLTQEQLRHTYLDEKTILPPYLSSLVRRKRV